MSIRVSGEGCAETVCSVIRSRSFQHIEFEAKWLHRREIKKGISQPGSSRKLVVVIISDIFDELCI